MWDPPSFEIEVIEELLEDFDPFEEENRLRQEREREKQRADRLALQLKATANERDKLAAQLRNERLRKENELYKQRASDAKRSSASKPTQSEIVIKGGDMRINPRKNRNDDDTGSEDCVFNRNEFNHCTILVNPTVQNHN